MHVELDGPKVAAMRSGALGATREEFAKAAGIALNTLRRIEGNRGAVTLRTARKIARVLDVEPKSLGRTS